MKFMSKNVLVVSAHADDMEFMCGGTIAKMVSKGYNVYQIIATNNEKGTYTLPQEILVEKSREEEAKKAAEFLGLKEVVFFNHRDGELCDVAMSVLREKIMKYIRKNKIDILFTWDPFAHFETHPDHRRISFAAVEAAEFSRLPLYHPEHKKEGILPYYVSEYFFFAKHPLLVNKFVDITDFIEKKITAILYHKTQTSAMIEGIRISLEAAGINPETVGIPKNLTDEIIENIISTGIKMQAAKVGEKINVPYAEEFRYQGYGMVEDIFPGLIKKEEI
jgi:LmbE family N-acetylglucosaminyl deacetylase